ncbi:MAG: hypothetical protein KatS3mg118_0635 [Paracoccaceae bacterium]|nr:MAG: hypothetical protein KatS3mg118_0635 [Paracoccaceae bacterium]
MRLRDGIGTLALAGLAGFGQPALSAMPAGHSLPAAPPVAAAQLIPAHLVHRATDDREKRREDRLGLTYRDRTNIQIDLYILGFDPRGIDGIFGPRTRAAIAAWQRAEGLPVTGYLREGQVRRLDRQAEARRRELREESIRALREAEREDNAYWRATGASGREADLRLYLRRYPDGLHAREARERLAEIERARERQARAEERAAWAEAVRADDIPAYRRYLRLYPDGLFADVARFRIEDLEEEARNQAQNARQREREEALGLNRASRRSVEERLISLGFEAGRADGEFDRATRRAIRAFQRTRGLAVTGFLNEPTLARLVAETR